MKHVSVLIVLFLVAGCGAGGQGAGILPTSSTPSTSTSTSEAPTTTTAPDPDQEVAALEPYAATVAEYLDLASTTFPALSVPRGLDSGMPANDVGGAIGGQVAPTASVYVLGQTQSDLSRGAVATVDASDNTIPAQLLAFVFSELDIADPDLNGPGPDPSHRFATEVLPALRSVDDFVQRFDFGETTLEMTVRAHRILVFAFVKSGQAVPAFVADLPGPSR